MKAFKLLFCIITLSILTTEAFAQEVPGSFAGKKIVIMGDSSTTPNMWPQKLISVYLPDSVTVVNSARGGTVWKNHIMEQWTEAKRILKAKTGSQTSPDILIITTGGNSFPDPKYSYDDVIALCESDPKDSGNVDQLSDAIAALRTITNEYPALEIYLVSNFYASSNPKKDQTRRQYRTQLSALCDYFSCHLIDLTRNSNIRGRLEKNSEKRIFTNDSTHLSTEEGKLRIARLVFAALKANHPTPEK